MFVNNWLFSFGQFFLFKIVLEITNELLCCKNSSGSLSVFAGAKAFCTTCSFHCSSHIQRDLLVLCIPQASGCVCGADIARVGSCFALECLRISRFDQRLKRRVTWIALICFVYLVASVSYSDFKGSLQIKRVSTLPSNLRQRLRGIRFVQEVNLLIQGVSSLVPQNKGRRRGRSGRSYRCPPGPRVVQTTVVAVFQAAGVWHAGGVVDFKPVRVVGDPTAAELQQRPKQRVTFNSHPSLIKTVYLPSMKH